MPKPHIDIDECLPDDVMRVMNKCARLDEQSHDVKCVIVYALREGKELVKFLLAPHYAEREIIDAKDIEEGRAMILEADCELTLTVRSKSGQFAMAKCNEGAGEPKCVFK